MANSKGRRKLRRMLQEAGLGSPLKPPSQSPQRMSVPFWKRIPAWVYALLGAFAIVVTLLEGYPWLSLEEGGFLDPANPYSQIFKIKNGGYIPVVNLRAECDPTFETSFNDKLHNFGVAQAVPFVDFLAHDGTAEIPCFSLIPPMPGEYPSGSKLDVIVTYGFWFLDYRQLRTSQTFHFISVVGKNGTQHWIDVTH